LYWRSRGWDGRALPVCDHNDVQTTLLADGGDDYRGADKFLARPGKKQATATEDFDVHISYL